MIELTQGNILKADAEALVNTVNCVGFMGKGIVAEVRRLGIRSIAVPPLGCGLGGLDWNKVRPMIEQAFAQLPDVRVSMFEPAGAPEAKAMPVRTARPKLTVARALFIRLMDQYAAQAYRLTLLEIQKLAYFLQEAGQPLRLKYQAGHYGPYVPNLNKVLKALERHYTSGYGDTQKPDVEIELLDGAAEEAEAFTSMKRSKESPRGMIASARCSARITSAWLGTG